MEVCASTVCIVKSIGTACNFTEEELQAYFVTEEMKLTYQ